MYGLGTVALQMLLYYLKKNILIYNKYFFDDILDHITRRLSKMKKSYSCYD